jgi:kumamolisin
MGKMKSKIRSTTVAVIFALAIATFAASANAAAGSVKILGNHPAQAAELVGQGSVPSDRQLGMQLTLALHNRADLDRLLAAQQDKSSPQYHHWISTAEFDARFGPTDADVQKVSSSLAQSGFTVDSASTRTRTIKFHATAAVAQKEFGVSIAASSDRKYFANLEDPAVPADIAPLVANIRGLSNTHAPLAAVNTSEFKPANAAASPEFEIDKHKAFGPNDLYTFYDETPLLNDGVNGAGAECIAILENSDFDSESVADFNSEFGLPPVSLSAVYADGLAPGENPDYVEAELDAQYGHAAAPGAPIVAYIGNEFVAESEGSDAIIDALSSAVTDNSCAVISISFGISFGLCGEPASLFTGTIDPLMAEAASANVGVYVSSGDEGSAAIVFSAKAGGCVIGKVRGVSELAADPNATGVGGTSFSPKYSKAGADVGNVKEKVWHDIGASGGGQSEVFPKPSFQSGVIPADSNRDVPDISLAASPLKRGFFLVLDEGAGPALWCCFGGTTLSAPNWAGIAELVAQQAGAARTGNINARLYTLGVLANPTASGLRDVTKGSNGFHGVAGFKATTGYDKATGWGTPDIAVLMPKLAAP